MTKSPAEAAAEAFCKGYNENVHMFVEQGFLEGVAWAWANESAEVEGLVTALKIAIYQTDGENPPFIYLPKSEIVKRMRAALAAWAERGKR